MGERAQDSTPPKRPFGPADAARLLADERCPSVRVARTGDRHVPVLAFIAFARDDGHASSDVERVTDAYVETIGGERVSVLDPWSWLPDLLRRLRGRPVSLRSDLWALPAGSPIESGPSET